MKIQKLWGLVAVAVAISVLVATLFGTGILANNNDQGTGMGTNSLFVYSNTAIGSVGVPVLTKPADICVESSRYFLGQEIVWRIRVLDEAHRPMDNKQLKSVVVEIPGGPTLNASYGGHPGNPGATPTDYFWSAVWTIPGPGDSTYPDGYPTGTFPYQVLATALHGKRTGTFNDFNVHPSLLTIVKPPS
jgi:hypothetical protein